VNIKPAQSVTPAVVSAPLKPSYFPNGLSYQINLFTTYQSFTICYFTYCPRVDIKPVPITTCFYRRSYGLLTSIF